MVAQCTPACCSPSPVNRAASWSILAAAETYLLITRLTNWDLDAYQDWLVTTQMRLTQAADRNS